MIGMKKKSDMFLYVDHETKRIYLVPSSSIMEADKIMKDKHGIIVQKTTHLGCIPFMSLL